MDEDKTPGAKTPHTPGSGLNLQATTTFPASDPKSATPQNY